MSYDEWNRARFKDVARLVAEKVPASATKHVDLEDVQSGATGRYRHRQLDQLREALSIEPGDVAYAKLRPYLRKTFRADEAMTGSTEFVVFRPHRVESAFLAFVMRSTSFSELAVAATNGVRMPRVSPDTLGAVSWLWPTVETQRRVAEFLDRECERISELQITALRGQAQLVAPAMDRACREFDRWPLGRISYAFEVQLGKMLDQTNIDPSDTSPYLRNANVHWNSMRLDDLKRMTFSAADRARFALRPGDLLVCEGGEPGRAAVWPGSDIGEPVYYQKALHRLRPIRGASPRYAMWMLRVLSDRSTFAVDGPGRYTHLTAEMLRAVRIPLPDAEQQHAVAAEIDDLDRRISGASLALDRLRDRLSEYRDALVTEAVTGQLDLSAVSDAQLGESAHAAMEGERPEVLSA